MADVKLKDLQKAAKELNEVLKVKPKVDITQDEEDLKGDILEVAGLITDKDDISDATQDVIDALRKPAKKKPAPVEDDEPADDEPADDEPSEEEPSEEEPADDEPDEKEDSLPDVIAGEVEKIVEKGLSKGKDKDWMLGRITEYFEDLELEEGSCGKEEDEEPPKKKPVDVKKKAGFARK